MALKVPQPLIDRLASYDAKMEPIGEIEVSGELIAALPSQESLTPDEQKGIHAEISALRFSPRHSAFPGRWNIYWHELVSGVSEDGTELLSPDIDEIDEEILAYWIERSQQSRHPVLRARYADLSWEIGHYLRAHAKRQDSVEKISIPVALCHQAIDSYLEVLRDNLFKAEPRAWIYLGRAIELALSLRDKPRIEQTKECLLSFYRHLDISGKQWMWWKLDELVWNQGTQLGINPPERQEVIDLLERLLIQFSDISDTTRFDPHSATSAADSLGRWRAQSHDIEEAHRAMKTAALAFEGAAERAGGIVAIAWLEDLIPRYRQAGMLEDATRIEQAIRQRAADAQAEMQSFETTVDIPREEVDSWISRFLTGSVVEALTLVAGQFVIREDTTRSSLHDMCKDAPLLSMISSSIVNADGFTTAKIGSIEEDPDGRALHHAATMVNWQTPWLQLALAQIRERYALDADELIKLIQKSPHFAPERIPLLHAGVVAWSAGDAVKAIHVLVPQIEAALRNLLTAFGGAVMVPNSEVGGFKTISMGQILSHPIFVDKMPQDIRFHLRALYNDPRGLNLRNELAHGLASAELLNMGLANWVIHTVILLSLIRVD